MTKSSAVITAFGVYTGHTTDLLDEDATIVFDRTTTTINVWNESGSLISTQTLIQNTQDARSFALSNDVITPHTMTVFMEKPFTVEAEEKYDVEHNLVPTDVTNHYSGAPITLMGADLWTCYGSSAAENGKLGIFQFFTVGERRRGRCCLYQGQIPFILYWPFI